MLTPAEAVLWGRKPSGKAWARDPSGNIWGHCGARGPLRLYYDGILDRFGHLPFPRDSHVSVSRKREKSQTQPHLTVSRGFVPKPECDSTSPHWNAAPISEERPNPCTGLPCRAPPSVTALPDNHGNLLPGVRHPLRPPSVRAQALQSEQAIKNINQIMSSALKPSVAPHCS